MESNLYFRFNQWHIIVALCLLAFSLRVTRCLVVNRINKDGVLYVTMAKNLTEGNTDKAFIENRRMPPLYIMLTTGLSRLGLSAEFAARLISVIAGSLLIIPLVLIVQSFFGKKAAALSGLLVAVHPSLVRISADIMRDSLFLLLLFTSLYFILYAIRKKHRLIWFTGGIFTALVSATRAEGIELIVALILWLIVDYFLTKKKKDPTSHFWKYNFTGILILLLSFSIVSVIISSSIKNTSSTWSVIDKRFIGYAKSLFSSSSQEVLKEENTL